MQQVPIAATAPRAQARCRRAAVLGDIGRKQALLDQEFDQRTAASSGISERRATRRRGEPGVGIDAGKPRE